MVVLAEGRTCTARSLARSITRRCWSVIAPEATRWRSGTLPYLSAAAAASLLPSSPHAARKACKISLERLLFCAT